jgi:deoxyribonuclease-1-like protein
MHALGTIARVCRWGLRSAALLLSAGLLLGCGLEPPPAAEKTEQPETQPVSHVPPVAQTGSTIRIASFNIQVFGQAKLDQVDVMERLAHIVRQFDVVAIQEVRSKEQNVLPNFLQFINADGSRYDYVLGPRQGRTVSKEQYAYVYNAATLELVPDSVYVVPDPDDLLHRPPLVAGFRVRGPPNPFTFTLINIHTDPDETATELDALADVYLSVLQQPGADDDVILLGDLNVNERKLGRLGAIPGMYWAISGEPTNTRLTQTYDNLLWLRQTTEFTGRSGVYNLMDQLGLTMDQALLISDHMPVWAEFSAVEAPLVATAPDQPQRLR